jgi:hypothetical protein
MQLTRKCVYVDEPAGERLDAALQLKQRECRWHQLEDDRAVFDLGAQRVERQFPPISRCRGR